MKHELEARLTPDGQTAPIADPKARPATGLIGPDGREEPLLRPALLPPAPLSPAAPVSPGPTDAELAALDAQPGFIV